MPRKARLNVPGTVVHIMSRILAGEALFHDDDDCTFFLNLFSQNLARVGYQCYGWALMSNHYHLIVRPSERELWEFMKPLNTGYAGYHRRKHRRDGPLFRDRYKSIVTQDQNYIGELVRYVHLNPVRAGICKNIKALDDYAWTGHSAIMGRCKRDFQDVDAVLKRFGKGTATARRDYCAFLQEGLELDGNEDKITGLIRSSNEGTQSGGKATHWVIGDHAFVKKALARADDARVRVSKFEKEGADPDAIARSVAKKFNVSPEKLKKHNRATPASEARKVFAWRAVHDYRTPSRLVAAYCGIGQAAVWAMARAGEKLAGMKGLK